MLPRSVSVNVVRLAALPLAILLYMPLLPVDKVLNQHLNRLLGLDEKSGLPYLCFAAYLLLGNFVLPRALSALGIQVRGRSVERLQPSRRDREGEVNTDLPIRIYRGQRLGRVMPNALFGGGLACLVLAGCIVFTWFPPPPGARNDPLVFTAGLLGIAFILLAGAFLTRHCKPDLLCEISEKGIRAPDGLLGRETLVPWEELARCEIIHDDERIWHDHFLLWDRAGRRRFRSSKNWLGLVSRSDRDRILGALRSRFPRKDKGNPGAEPALVHQASAAVWDRDLDG